MKTIKPKQTQTQTLIIDNHKVTQFKEKEEVVCEINPDNVIKEDNNDTIEDLMNSVLQNNNYVIEKEKENPNLVKVKFYLTKRQYDLYTKKGGESWLKKALVGVKQGKKKKKQDNEK